ncbi:hypothetical protein Tco_0242504 [Tanacetum coccineum]
MRWSFPRVRDTYLLYAVSAPRGLMPVGLRLLGPEEDNDESSIETDDDEDMIFGGREEDTGKKSSTLDSGGRDQHLVLEVGGLASSLNFDVHKKLCSYNLPSCSIMPWALALSSRRAVAKKDTQSGMEIRFVTIVWTKMGKTWAPEDTKKRVVGRPFEYMFER